MNDCMAHRGPDDSGEWVCNQDDGFRIGLGHRRLSILDLSSAGHQPMDSADGNCTIIFNGEIYNYVELKEQIGDYPYKTECDTEVLLAVYEKYGIEGVEQLNGMFAFAVYDHNKQELILVRDRIGKKPLYYWINSGEIVFASELKPIMKYPGYTLEIDKNSMSELLLNGYICSPNTIFKNIYKVRPGEIIRIKNGEVTKYKYWDIASKYKEKLSCRIDDYNIAKSELKGLLREAVKERLVADVPYGCFLSGGIDSSLVSAIAQDILGQERLKTFSIGFEQSDFNEAEDARRVADYLGTEHIAWCCTKRDMLRLIESIPEYFDEPFADSSQIPTMLVSELAKKDVTVALSGDGGDELFCGYNEYEYIRLAQKLDIIGAMLHKIGTVGGLEERYPIRIKAITKNRDLETKTQFTKEPYIEIISQMLGTKMHGKYQWESRYQTDNWQTRRMLLDMETYLPDDILAKVDRSSMKYSLECRCPILDKNVIEYSFRINHKFKYRNGEKKAILKDIAYDYIPRDLLDRPKKGFSAPIDEFMRNELKESMLSYADVGFLIKQGIFNSQYTNRIINGYLEIGDSGRGTGRNYSQICWSFFMFQLWWEQYIKR